MRSAFIRAAALLLALVQSGTARGAAHDPDAARGAAVDRVQNVIRDGDMLVVQHALYRAPGEAGTMIVDFWRIDHQRKAGHWQVAQPIPAQGTNPMICGRADQPASEDNPACGPLDPDQSRRDSLRVVADYVALLRQGRVREAVDRYLSSDYRQYNPAMQPGREGAYLWLSREFSSHTPPPRMVLLHRLAQQDLVIEHHRIIRADGTQKLQADIFRVERGRITAHWDVMQLLPPQGMDGPQGALP